MRIPKFWAKETYSAMDKDGATQSFSAWGWSVDNLAAAKAMAIEKAKKIWSRVTSDSEHIKAYEYLEVPLREEIVETRKRDESEIAIITRNRYGALVLNSASVFFADVDYPKVRARGFFDFFSLLFSSEKRKERKNEIEKETLSAVRNWARKNSGRSLRIYKTAAGMRLLFTDKLYDPKSPEVKTTLEELGADELYKKLTLRQGSFRARLTPKPWRCGCGDPPNRYPWTKTEDESKYRDWQKKYEESTRKYGICKFVEQIGTPLNDTHISEVIAMHDGRACKEINLILA